MTGRIRLSAAAQRDIGAAKEWYADQGVPGLDLRFLRALEAVFERMATLPASFRVVYRDVRQANLQRFPFAVFYHERGDDLYVLAVCHHARDPRVWQRRR